MLFVNSESNILEVSICPEDILSGFSLTMSSNIEITTTIELNLNCGNALYSFVRT